MAPKKKGGKKAAAAEDWEAELGETAPVTTGNVDATEPTADANSAEAGDEGEDENSGGGGLMAIMRRNKQKQTKKEAEAVPVQEPGRLLTKAEKEKLKKEREKQRKKEQASIVVSVESFLKRLAASIDAAALKKKNAPAAPATPAAAVKKEENEVAAPAAAPDTPEPTASSGSKKKIPAHLRLIQQQQEERRKREEEAAAAAAAEKARLEELERKEAEEAIRREEIKAAKKQREKERIEQLKREGKFLTKAQKEEKLRNERKLQQMLAAGIKVGAMDDDKEKKKKKEDQRKKGRGGPNKVDEQKALEEAAERARLEAEALAKIAADKAAAEKAAADKAEAEAAAAKAAEEDDVKDSWDASSDEETEENAASANAKKDSDEDEDDGESSEDEEAKNTRAALEAQRKQEAAERREKAHQAALNARSADNLRSPICCILGHVDTGKTKLLDKVRQTNVQEGEAGGITQQIGATYFPVEAIKQKTQVVNRDNSFEFKVPGLLIIDTPGHESFSNLRSRGSSLCNIAILVVDIMHGLEQQTLESMRMLRDRKTPFIVALNKIDRLYGWNKIDNNGFRDSLSQQNSSVQKEFQNRLDQTKLAFAEQGFNAELFYENRNMSKNVSLVPTSAHTGEGVPDMLKLLLQLTQDRMVDSLMYLSEVQATVLEVKAIEGFGMTIDVILSNGVIHEGDRIVLCGTEGAIVTNIRALLTPAPMRELRVKGSYVHNKEIKAAMGVKISAPGLEGAIAGSRLLVVGPDDDEDDLIDEVESDLATLFSRVETTGRGVSVQASTLGSLEALLDFLKDCKIPVATVGIGPVYKRDIMQTGVMLEKSPDHAVMLCFDVKVDKEAQQYAEENCIKIFQADIIYHLFDSFTAHQAEMLEKKKEESKMLAVFPCVLNTVAVFNKTTPIVIGVDVAEGQLKINTPLAAVRTGSNGQKEIVGIGRVTSIERDHKQIPVCKKGQPSVAVKIEMGNHQPTYGRHLEESDKLYSLISRASIDCLKDFYRAEVTNEEWLLIKKLKPLFDIA
ncbi:Eukaryotic translation initiation factor 5B [Ceratocystis fimbriata CBS 114723]|uniref:Eukaryotic translation initiation factor 5B n=1 Tax=Ceratocystis fimbriata CBS 114723 TaxID=1035309 RepID=A0A2C5X048_9PEZI|nr:Eukaryotic translation initiation factor 5B [Ceratocystis fimbriata CBS 114723]